MIIHFGCRLDRHNREGLGVYFFNYHSNCAEPLRHSTFTTSECAECWETTEKLYVSIEQIASNVKPFWAEFCTNKLQLYLVESNRLLTILLFFPNIRFWIWAICPRSLNDYRPRRDRWSGCEKASREGSSALTAAATRFRLNSSDKFILKCLFVSLAWTRKVQYISQPCGKIDVSRMDTSNAAEWRCTFFSLLLSGELDILSHVSQLNGRACKFTSHRHQKFRARTLFLCIIIYYPMAMARALYFFSRKPKSIN